MHDKPSADLVGRWYRAFLDADAADLQELVAPDFALHVAGKSAVAGSHTGGEGMLALRGKLAELSGNTFRGWREGSWDVAVSEVHAAVMDRWVGELGEAKLDSHVVLVLAMEQGKLAIGFLYFTDQHAFDAFFR